MPAAGGFTLPEFLLLKVHDGPTTGRAVEIPVRGRLGAPAADAPRFGEESLVVGALTLSAAGINPGGRLPTPASAAMCGLALGADPRPAATIDLTLAVLTLRGHQRVRRRGAAADKIR